MSDAAPPAGRAAWPARLLGILVGAVFDVWYLTGPALVGLGALAWYLLDATTAGIVLATAGVVIVFVNLILSGAIWP